LSQVLWARERATFGLMHASRHQCTYGVSSDGRRLLMMPLISSEQSATQVNLVLNFLTELRQRVR
jgi:hypothetical protein